MSSIRGIAPVSRQASTPALTANVEPRVTRKPSVELIDTAEHFPPPLRAAAERFLTRNAGSKDAQRCLALVEQVRGDLSEEQTQWLLQSIRFGEVEKLLSSEIPTAPMELDRCLALLERADPRPVRYPLQATVAKSLGQNPLLTSARAALPDLSTEQLLRLSFHIEPTHGLRRELSRVIEERLQDVPAIPRATPTSSWAALDTGVAGDVLARRWVERGKTIIGSELLAKADELRSLPPAQDDPAIALLRASLRLDLERGLAGVVSGLIAKSPVSRAQALATARSVFIETYDAFGRARMLDTLATVVQLTRGAVLRIITEMRDHDVNTRPELRKRLERAQNRPQQPMFPLANGDGLTASIHANPMMPTEVFHELGHAYECAEPDVVRAAVALREMLAIGKARPLNDLSIIYEVAAADGRPGTHARLLTRLAERETWPALDSAAAVRAFLADCDVDAAIERVVGRNEDAWRFLRPYGADEKALPLAAHPYLGKIDPDASTELVSVGFEKLPDAESLAKALLDCPDHVAFTLGCLP